MPECNLCSNTIGYYNGIVGSNSDVTKFLFVLNKPDKRILQPSLNSFDNYKTALFSTKTGAELDRILKYCNMTVEDVFLTNIFKCIFNSDKDPAPNEYKKCYENVFKKQFSDFNPKKIIVFGGSAYAMMFPHQSVSFSYEDAYGKYALYNNTQTLIMPHPSRIWAFRNEHKIKDCYEKIKDFLTN